MERRSRHEEATAASLEHSRDQEQVRELTNAVDEMRRALSQTQEQLDDWEAADSPGASSAQLDALIKAQGEASEARRAAEAAEARAAAAEATSRIKVSIETVLVVAVAAWPLLVVLLAFLAHTFYGTSSPGAVLDQGLSQAASQAGAPQAAAQAAFEATFQAQGPGLAKTVLEETVAAATAEL
mmetsp:Transcript_62964/g.142127  ORF Transcript_62964/g.142127 Transcript_62964/m.142127 type:complete len:183 (+) Transcript_62964:361-909(+)